MADSRKLLLSFIAAGIVGIILYVTGVLRNNTFDYWYLIYNLVLALIPLLLALWFQRYTKRTSRRQWLTLVILLLWVLFLPNTFYIVTDFIHLPETQRVDIVQDVVMLMQFSVLGVLLGLMSVYIMHKNLLQYVRPRIAAVGIVFVLFLSSFAIYLGRELRWNSWDIVVHPLWVVRDVIEAANPFSHPVAAWMTFSFFLMITSLYAVWWYGLSGNRK